jgi:hypothetical protein
MLQRRKSLGDVIGTIRKKAMTRYNTISHHRGRQPEAMTAFDDAHLPGEQLEQELRDFAPVVSLHLPGASFEENVDPVTMVDQMVDGENVTCLDTVPELTPVRLQTRTRTTAYSRSERF